MKTIGLIAVYLGVDSIKTIETDWPVIAFHLIGGATGTFLGLLKRKQK